MSMTAAPASLTAPVAPGIERHLFPSPADGSRESFLLKDFRPPGKRGGELSLAVVYLHGAASHEAQGMTSGIYGNAFGRLAQEIERREAVYVCPEYRGGSWMGPAAEADVLEIFRLVRASYRPRKIVLMGGSMGGTSALIFAARHPREMDGVIALCPASDVAEMVPAFPDQFRISYGGTPEEIPREYLERSVRHRPGGLFSLPLAIVHGADDRVIPVRHSRLLADQLLAKGTRLHYVEMEGGDHDAPIHVAWTPLFDFVLAED